MRPAGPGRRVAGAVTAVVGTWAVVERQATAEALLGPWPSLAQRRLPTVARCRPTGPAVVVLGSAQRRALPAAGTGQPEASAEAGAEGRSQGPADLGPTIDVVVRRAGGGAVQVFPGGQAWLDIWVPRNDPAWADDPAVTAAWIGHAWAEALGDLGVTGAAVHTGGLGVPVAPGPEGAEGGMGPLDDLGRAVCFASLGPGEVVVGPDRRKLVGISQLRTRAGARVLTMAPLHWDPLPLLRTLAALGVVDAAGIRELARAAAERAVGLERLGLRGPAPTVIERVERAVLGRLLSTGGPGTA